jgi:hypothetical protein
MLPGTDQLVFTVLLGLSAGLSAWRMARPNGTAIAEWRQQVLALVPAG